MLILLRISSLLLPAPCVGGRVAGHLLRVVCCVIAWLWVAWLLLVSDMVPSLLVGSLLISHSLALRRSCVICAVVFVCHGWWGACDCRYSSACGAFFSSLNTLEDCGKTLRWFLAVRT